MEALAPESPPPGKKAACDPPPTLEEAEQDGSVIEPGPRGRALANEYILMELFSYLKPEDLMECRLVNQVWRLMATKAIGQNSPMVHFGRRNQMDDLIEFMKTVDNSDLKPNKFAVDSAILLGYSAKEKSMLSRFFEKVAPVATHLKITLSADSADPLPIARPNKETQYPNLQSLEINSLEDRRRISNAFLIDILGHAPQLERVSIRTETAGTLDDVIEAIPWSKIRHLQLKGEMHRGSLERIVDLEAKTLQLKSLKLELSGKWGIEIRETNWGRHRTMSLGSLMVNLLLKKQCETLEELKLHFKKMPMWSFINLPRFPKLRKLELCKDAWSAVLLRPPTVAVASFADKFPVLESFSISEFKWVSFSIFLHDPKTENMIPVDTVKELKLDVDLGNGEDQINEAFARRFIQKTASIFPGVTKLGLPASQLLSQTIEAENVWRDVEELTLLCDDKSCADCVLLDSPKNDETQQEAEKPEALIFSFLQQIKTLNFETGYKSGVGKPSCISDAACRSVLLKLPNLKLVNLAALKEHHVSEAVISEMREKLLVVRK